MPSLSRPLSPCVGTLLLAVLTLLGLNAGCEGDLLAEPSGGKMQASGFPDIADARGGAVDLGRTPGTGGDAGLQEDSSQKPGPSDPPPCDTPTTFLEQTAWPAVVKPVCVGCHIEGGIATSRGSQFVLWSDATLAARPELTLDEFFTHNLEQLRTFSGGVAGADATFVRKALGELGHGGGSVVNQGSEQMQALVGLADRLAAPVGQECQKGPGGGQVDQVLQLRDPAQTYRKAAILFGGRLPTKAELAALEGNPGSQAWTEVDRLLLGMFQEPAFHDWLKYAWNEVFHFRGMRQAGIDPLIDIISGVDFATRAWSQMSEDKPGIKCSDTWEGLPNWQRFDYESLKYCDGPGVRRGLSARTGWSLMEGPLELIAWIVRQGRPFTDILTTEKVAMNYYSSLAYYGSAQPQDNPFVAQHLSDIPTETVNFPGEGGAWGGLELPEMKHFYMMDSVKRTGSTWMQRPNFGRHYLWHYEEVEQYPRAGLLTDQIFLNRYQTTDTNVNRHRSWAYFNFFLGVDILALADRRGDPTKAELSSDAPTIEDANCNVCHKVMDPVAGMFQDFAERGHWKPKDVWPPATQPPMLQAGFSDVGGTPGELYDVALHGQAPLVVLAARTAKDPRFARRMVEHAFFQVIGRYPLTLPQASGTPEGQGMREAYEIERAYLAQATKHFVDSNYDMRTLLLHLVKSSFFRVRGLQEDADLDAPGLRAALEAWGLGLLRTPEMLQRQVEAALGRPWPVRAPIVDAKTFSKPTDHPFNDFLMRAETTEAHASLIDDEFRDLYGGVDFFTHTTRLRKPSSTMSAVAQRTANEVACVAVPQEFALPSAKRMLFGGVEPDDLPTSSEVAIKQVIARLHQRFLGPHRATDTEVDQSYQLFVEVQQEGRAQLASGGTRAELNPHCRAAEPVAGLEGSFTPVTQDPDYTLRAYMAVVTALVLDFEFLFEL